MILHLVDLNEALVAAWRAAFRDFDEVKIHCCDILSIARNTVVSPANGYGVMAGGIDGVYTRYFGTTPQTEIQQLIGQRDEGYLPVGEAVFVVTGDTKIPYMISAPTMLTPGPIPASNCFLAMSAMLKTAEQHSTLITDIYCPGLGTMTGRVGPVDAAAEMVKACRLWKEGTMEMQ